MSQQTDLLNSLRVASPCHVSWDDMTGDDRVRFCSSCRLNVYNFAAMSSAEVNDLIIKSEGRICGRLYRRFDGTIITRDCPIGLGAVRRKVRRIAGAAFATMLSLASVAMGQTKKDVKTCTQSTVSFERSKDKGQIGNFTGVVVDWNEARVPGALVMLINDDDKGERSTKTDDQGVFTFAGVIDGTYTVQISAVGFKTSTFSTVQLRSDELTRTDIHLNTGEPTVLTGLVGLPIKPLPQIEYSNGTMIIRGDAIRKLPLP